jgi:hypothetical protein
MHLRQNTDGGLNLRLPIELDQRATGTRAK